ncbi:putative nuclease HARBI1 [Orchesella cincta]|uniref:Putative nuclease HARBI1 n=1 Tax=Orchesella cincta TaxID=48709 RepID=A0A1D2M299_ORCCI|nr:putative nuclease HARBI1 [Orchesella cincta]
MAEIAFILENRRAIRRERVLRDREDPLAYSDDELIKRFRFPKAEILELFQLIRPNLRNRFSRNQPLIPIMELCAALRFYAKGAFQQDNGDTLGLSQPTISKAIRNVTDSLLLHQSKFIRFPNLAEQRVVQAGFYAMKGVPKVIGIIDGSHVFIRRPTTGPDEKLYVCRKGGHSINVQLVCDHDMKITDVVAKWPGSTHDAYIWRNCGLREKFEANPPSGYLLGDSAYPLEPWMYTAILQPRTESELRHNVKIKGTRRLVENAIGLLKSRFRCIDKSGGILYYSPLKVSKYVVVCCMLHNKRRGLRLPEDENLEGINTENDEEDENIYQGNVDHTTPLRQRLVDLLGA